MKSRILVALGGNALLRRGDIPDASVELAHVREAAQGLARAAAAHQLVIVHGNGPQVGLLAMESSSDSGLTRPYPLDALVAETQGLLGYWLQQSIANACPDGHRVVTVVTQTEVAADDPAFGLPDKFVGAVYDREQADVLASERGWAVAADGTGWRRVVPSPRPVRIVEAPVVDELLKLDVTVVCAGGGGSPVVQTDEGLRGVEAVVDKDHVAALLARTLGANLLVLLTDVPAVIDGYGTAKARPIGRTTAESLGRMQFPAGSMGPKVAAACRFATETGGTAAIGSLDDIDAVIAGTAGTRVLPPPLRPGEPEPVSGKSRDGARPHHAEKGRS
jgi:carbamate kinase